MHNSKELEDNSPAKNDYKDARVIADLVRNGRYSEPNCRRVSMRIYGFS
ncbi:hypothetical protein ACFQ5D_13520 [Paenibacillus farraposensis]|uniref:Transposase n=1 Tax=Paenibacillus farraposensis TaxID=2807095 RepID=A0ABW4DED3_9BACL|nr:hypothetical protein [Paenibacillus farraposensis]